MYNVSDKCCSSELSIHQKNFDENILLSCFQHINNNYNYKCVSFLAANHNVRMISEGLCDWSNDTKNQL